MLLKGDLPGDPALPSREQGSPSLPPLWLGSVPAGSGAGQSSSQPRASVLEKSSVPISALGIYCQMPFLCPQKPAWMETFGYFTLKWNSRLLGEGGTCRICSLGEGDVLMEQSAGSSHAHCSMLDGVTRSSSIWFSSRDMFRDAVSVHITQQCVLLLLNFPNLAKTFFLYCW